MKYESTEDYMQKMHDLSGDFLQQYDPKVGRI